MRIDCRGQRCPIPVIELAKALPHLELGQVVEVLSDDPASAADVAAWCQLRGQGYDGSSPEGDAVLYRVRRLS